MSSVCSRSVESQANRAEARDFASASTACSLQACYEVGECLTQPCSLRRSTSFSEAVEASRREASRNPDDAKLSCVFYADAGDGFAHLVPASFPAEEYSTCGAATQAFFPVLGVWEDLGAFPQADAPVLLARYLQEMG